LKTECKRKDNSKISEEQGIQVSNEFQWFTVE